MATTTNFQKTILGALSLAKGCTFVSVTIVSEAKMNKKGNPLAGRVIKIADYNCQYNFNYENAVNNRIAKQGGNGNFEAQSLPWGEWVRGYENRIIAHKGEYYVRFYLAKNCKAEISYLVDGRPATAEEIVIIKAFTPARKPSGTQSASGLTTNQVDPFTAKLANIYSLTINGATYSEPIQIAANASI